MSRNDWIAGCIGFAILAVCACAWIILSAGGISRYIASIPTLSKTASPQFVRPLKPTTRPSAIAIQGTLTHPATPTQALHPRPLQTATPSHLDKLTHQSTPLTTPSPLPAVVFSETLLTLQQATIPESDLLQLAAQLEGKSNLARTVDPSPPHELGDRQTFWVSNTDTNEHFQVETILQAITEHAYFWIEDGVRFDADDLRRLAETFEQQIYPTNQAFFGSEWTPGVDGDPHLYILYVRGVGESLAGYYSSADEYPPSAHEYSNAHETFVFNADNMHLDDEDTASTLAHEFQHMIHWNRDRNEETWMNEGFSMLAEFINGYAPFFDYWYIIEPDLQLNTWGAHENGPHYGASFLFLAYFLDRFGETTTQKLVAEPENGLDSIDRLLAAEGIINPQSGAPLGADDVFLDWVIANYVKDGHIADGRFTYSNYPQSPQASETERISTCPSNLQSRDVNPYGVDYIRITCAGQFNLHFEGSVQTQVIPADPHSGAHYFWSNRGDESAMTLSRTFDFTHQSGTLTLSYWTWYDLETDYDYLYLEASSDGETWQILDTPSCTTADPSGNSYGCGYNGASYGWQQETVDLSSFAGQQVTLRFQYITDAAVNGEGLVLDDIAIPEIHYFTDFETDDGGWQGEGFVRIQNVLPQTYRLALISQGEATTVEYVTLDANVSADIPLDIAPGDEVTLVVTATSRFTHQKAAYRFEIQR